jgi:hypothetical protein
MKNEPKPEYIKDTPLNVGNAVRTEMLPNGVRVTYENDVSIYYSFLQYPHLNLNAVEV